MRQRLLSAGDPTLTKRQLDVLRAAAIGLNNKGIGRALGIREQTVKNHCWLIYEALGLPKNLRNKLSAIRAAVRCGWITLGDGG